MEFSNKLSWFRQKFGFNSSSNEGDRKVALEKEKQEEELRRRVKELEALCKAVKAANMDDLQHILCAMVLSECVYKRDTDVMMEAINKFKEDFGGQLVNLKRVQPSLGHVPHRYLLAEAGDTLFASFIGTKHYRDFITNANIFQGAVFNDGTREDNPQYEKSEPSEESQMASASNQEEAVYKDGQLESSSDRVMLQTKDFEGGFRPAAHRGFLARAKGIPAVELYRLAQKRHLKLVLCGHSMGGAVAVLATLAILRTVPTASIPENRDCIPVKCITFAQPPVGNAGLRDYVHGNGWQRHFRTYCIPEDIVPRILSPAYFQHYVGQFSEDNSQNSVFTSSLTNAQNGSNNERETPPKAKQTERESLVLGLGPVHNSFQRLSRLVPMLGVQKQLDWLRGRNRETETSKLENSNSTSKEASSPVLQSLEIQEGADGVSLSQHPTADKGLFSKNESAESKEARSRESLQWNRVPSFPKYVPFGQLHLLAKASVESLSSSEYASLTSVQSVFTELREQFQAHSMKSYRSRFHKIYELCLSDKSFQDLGMEYLPQKWNSPQWLGLIDTGHVEIGNIAETHIIQTAISIVPLGWNGAVGEKNGSQPFQVDVYGYGLHMCTLVQAEIDGCWCSTAVDSLPAPPHLSTQHSLQLLQKMCLQIGTSLKQIQMQRQTAPLIHTSAEEVLTSHIIPKKTTSSLQYKISDEAASCQPKGLTKVIIHCSSDFITTSKEVYMRTRRVRLLGLEGAGKTSLYCTLLGQPRDFTRYPYENIIPDTEWQEGIARGIGLIDPAGVNLQDLSGEVTRWKQELSVGHDQLRKKIDLVVLVHNLAHKIPCLHHTLGSAHPRPALLLFIDEATAAGIPWVLAITNKYAISADHRKLAVDAVVEAYQVPSNMFVVLNSCAYAVYGTEPRALSCSEINAKEHIINSKIQEAAQRLITAPMNLVQMPFRRKEVILPVEGVNTLWKIIQQVLISHEESAFQELAKVRLLIEEKMLKTQEGASNNSNDTALAATVGAGVGIVVAIIMGVASAFRGR